jgi:hypothetical protein
MTADNMAPEITVFGLGVSGICLATGDLPCAYIVATETGVFDAGRAYNATGSLGKAATIGIASAAVDVILPDAGQLVVEKSYGLAYIGLTKTVLKNVAPKAPSPSITVSLRTQYSTGAVGSIVKAKVMDKVVAPPSGQFNILNNMDKIISGQYFLV